MKTTTNSPFEGGRGMFSPFEDVSADRQGGRGMLEMLISIALFLTVTGCSDLSMSVEEYKEIDAAIFCACVNQEDIGSTIPYANQYLNSLNRKLNDEQRATALANWYQSFPCINEAKIIPSAYGHPAKTGVSFSFTDKGIIRELTLDFSSVNKVLSYHYDLITSAYVKTKRHITIDRVFDFINTLPYSVNYIYSGVYISSLPPEKLQYILDCLNAKPYTNDGNAWRVTGYLHYQTNQITIFSRLFNMNNKAYQTDWLSSMKEFQLEEQMDYDYSGHIIVFRFPEDPQNKGIPEFDSFDFVEWAEFSGNRYTIFDKSIEKEAVGVGVSVDSEISLLMSEDFKASPRTFHLRCATAKQYSSGSNPIVTTHQITSSSIDISFKGVAEIGMTADIGPANGYINLGTLKNGKYRLNLFNGNSKRSGDLVITSDHYQIAFPQNPEFRFIYTQLNRLPEFTIWGTIGYHQQGTSVIVQSFLDQLVSAGAKNKSFISGYYGEFIIDGKGAIVQPGKDSGYYFAQNFIYQYAGHFDTIEQLVKKFARDYGNNYLYISIYSDKGDQALSWMYNN